MLQIPSVLIYYIATFLTAKEVYNLRLVCKKLSKTPYTQIIKCISAEHILQHKKLRTLRLYEPVDLTNHCYMKNLYVSFPTNSLSMNFNLVPKNIITLSCYKNIPFYYDNVITVPYCELISIFKPHINIWCKTLYLKNISEITGNIKCKKIIINNSVLPNFDYVDTVEIYQNFKKSTSEKLLKLKFDKLILKNLIITKEILEIIALLTNSRDCLGFHGNIRIVLKNCNLNNNYINEEIFKITQLKIVNCVNYTVSMLMNSI